MKPNDWKIELPSVSTDLKRKAQKLIDSPAHKGNNGFTGDALDAWRIMRKTILVPLKGIVKGKWPTNAQEMAAYDATCPREFLEYDYENETYPAGTEAGEQWVMNARDFISKVRSHRRDELSALGDQARELAREIEDMVYEADEGDY